MTPIKEDPPPPPEPDEVHEQLMREGQPTWLTNQFVDRPCTIILLCMLLLLIVTVVSYSLGYFEMDPQSNREFLLWDDPRTIAMDKQSVAYDALKLAEGGQQKALRTQTMLDWNAILLYMAPSDKDLINKEYLLTIQKYEEHITSMENWNKLCKAASIESTECSPTESFVSALSFLKLYDLDLATAPEQEIQRAWQKFVGNNSNYENYKLLFPHRQ